MTIPAQRSFPYDGAVGGDSGPYSADYFALIMQAMLGNYTRRTTSGVILGVGNGTQESLNVEQTSPTSLGVLVREGWAMVNGRMYQASVDVTVPIVQNNDPSLNNRIDSIVVRIDKSTPSGTLVAKQGTVAVSPVPPSLTQNSTVWEIRLANVTVTNGATTILTANIDNTARGYAVKWPVKNGGTDLTTIAAGQLIAGLSTDAMVQIAAPTNYQLLSGRPAVSGGMQWGGDQRLTKIRANGGGAIGLNPTLIPFASADMVDPGSLVTSLSSNQLRLTAGDYWMWGWIGLTSDAVVNYAFWMSLSTTPNTPIARSEGKNSSGTVSFPNVFQFEPTFFSVDGTQLLEFYGERGGAATSALTTYDTTGITPGAGGYGRCLSFFKVRGA